MGTTSQPATVQSLASVIENLEEQLRKGEPLFFSRAVRLLDDLRAVLAAAPAPAQQEREAALLDALEMAWGVIANAYGGDWLTAGPIWRNAANRWRDSYFELLRALAAAPAPAQQEREELIAAAARAQGRALARHAARQYMRRTAEEVAGAVVSPEHVRVNAQATAATIVAMADRYEQEAIDEERRARGEDAKRENIIAAAIGWHTNTTESHRPEKDRCSCPDCRLHRAVLALVDDLKGGAA